MIPTLLFSGRYERADDGEIGCRSTAAEPAGDFLLDLHHAAVAFGLIVSEGNGRVVEEAQRILLARREAQEEIVPGAAGRATAMFSACCCGGGRERRLRLMEGKALGEDGIITALEAFDQAGLEHNATVARGCCRFARAGSPRAAVSSARHSTAACRCWNCSIQAGVRVRQYEPAMPRFRPLALQSAQ